MTLLKKPLLFLLMGVLLVGTAVSTHALPATQQTIGQFTPSDCSEIDLGVDFVSPAILGFECGYVTVPEQHSQPEGPTIQIPVAVLAAQSMTAQPDPLFIAQGGPGGDAFAVYALLAPNTPTAVSRDLVIFNQRGTLYSQPDLLCEELWDSVPDLLRSSDEEASQISDQAITDCYQRLQNEGINLSAYDSLENAADIELIRQALGYDTYNFYGVSYGTLLGLHLMNSQPPALRSVILDSVVPTQTNFALQIPYSENRAYDEYFAFCAADTVCSELYPDLEERLTAVYERLNENPATIRLRDDETGRTVRATIDGDDMRSIIFQLFYLRDFYAIFPRVVADLEAENYQYIQTFYPLFAFDRTLSNGMYFSVFCAEEGNFSTDELDLAGIRPFIANQSRAELDELLKSCQLWEVEPLPASANDPVQSSIPTLLLSGRFDPITPPPFADEAALTLPNGYHFVDPTGSHGNAFSGHACVDQIVANFLNNPDTAPNGSCLEEATYAGVVPDGVIQVPRLLDIANFETGALVQFGLFLLFSLLLLSGVVLWPLVFLIRRLRERPKTAVAHPTARLVSRLLVIVIGIMGLLFIGGFVINIVQLFENNALLLYSAFPASARLLFLLPLLMLLLAGVAVALLIRSWSDASVWGKVFHGLLIVCLVGNSVILFTLRLVEPLFA